MVSEIGVAIVTGVYALKEMSSGQNLQESR